MRLRQRMPPCRTWTPRRANWPRALALRRALDWSHNVGVVECIADDVAVMQAGKIVEAGPSEALLSHPAQTYTRTLLAAVPRVMVTA